jgi:hypothetical protein
MLSVRLCPAGTTGWRLTIYNALRYGGAIVLFAAAMALFPQPAALAAAIFMLTTFFTGQLQYLKPYYEVLKMPIVMVQIMGGVILTLFVWGIRKNRSDVAYSLDFITGLFLAFLCIYAIIKGQGRLDYLMDRRGHKLSDFPQNLRNYNLALVGILLLGLVLAFVFRKPIGAFLYPLMDGLMFAVKCIVAFIIWLRWPFEMIRRGGGGFTLKNYLDELPDFKPPGTKDNIVNLLILILVLSAAFLILFNWKHIVSGFRRFWGWIRSFLASKRIKSELREENDYTDREENLTEDRAERGGGVSGWKAWRKSYHVFYKMEDSEEKLRCGYRLMVEWLNLKGTPVHPSDTPLEILKKSQEKIRKASAGGVTEEYNNIRYGEKNADRNRMQQLVETMKRLYADARPAKETKKARRAAKERG